MKFLLFTALACLVSATEEPLQFSGNFNTIYLASKYMSVTGENSEYRILMREVKYFKNYKLMRMMFYVRKNGMCQIHTAWADKRPSLFCFSKRNFFAIKCPIYNGTKNIIGTWVLRDAIRHFPQIYYNPGPEGRLDKRPSDFLVEIHFVSNTSIVFEVRYFNHSGYKIWMTAALARGSNVTEEVWEEYVKLTRYHKIPTENIENVYEADTCPKWEH